jgi:antitoxin Phd
MRYATNSDTEPKLSALLDSAQREPVFIERDDQEVAVILSVRDYNRISGKATRDFLAFCDTIAEDAAAKGLTEKKLEELLSNA